MGLTAHLCLSLGPSGVRAYRCAVSLRRWFYAARKDAPASASPAKLPSPTRAAVDRDLVIVDALKEVRRDLRLPAGTIDAHRAALLADELARPERRRRLNSSQPAAPPAHPRPRRQHPRAVVVEHRRGVPAGKQPVAGHGAPGSYREAGGVESEPAAGSGESAGRRRRRTVRRRLLPLGLVPR